METHLVMLFVEHKVALRRYPTSRHRKQLLGEVRIAEWNVDVLLDELLLYREESLFLFFTISNFLPLFHCLFPHPCVI